MTDTNGNTIYYEYSVSGKLTRVTNQMGNRTEYMYDKADRLIYLCQHGTGIKDIRETWYERNALGQVESITDALGEKECLKYDALARVIQRIDKEGNSTEFSYAADGRLEHILYEDQSEVEMEYTPQRMLAKVKDWAGEIKIERNVQGMPVRVTDHAGRTVSYEWGMNGERRSMTYPGGKEVSFLYDKMLRLEEVIKTEPGKETVRIAYCYDEEGRLAEKHMPGGIKTTWHYNAYGELEELIHEDSGGILDRYLYEYDDVGNKVAVAKKRRGLPQECGYYTYGYDSAGRLICVEKDGKKMKSYTYDSFGNRTGMEDYSKDSKITYEYNTLNQLVKEEKWNGGSASAIERKTYAYDKRGNLIEEYQDGNLVHSYIYNAMNRLGNAMNQDGASAVYHYNGLGQRIGRDKEEYLLDLTSAENNLLEIIAGDGKQDFYWDVNVSFMEETEMPSRYFLADELGSPVRVLYGTGKGDTYGYDEFGNDLYKKDGYTASDACGQESGQPFGYTGYRYDEISGTYFAQAREYQPEKGRFLSKDKDKYISVGDPSSVNLYSYCKNSPLNYVDISGNEVIIVSGGNDDYNEDEVGHYQYMFVEPALKNVNDSIAAGTPKEDITWLVIDAGYSDTQLNNFQETADKLGVNFVPVSDKTEFSNYINTKNGGTTRSEDKITEMAIFSHGQCPRYSGSEENQLSFALYVENLKGILPENIDFTQSDIASLNSNAFDKTITTFYSCNAGTNDFNGNSFAQTWSNKTGGLSYGIKNGRTYYGTINMAGSWGFHAGDFTFLPGEVWNKAFDTELWQAKTKRKEDRALKGYSDLGSLNYPWLVSWAGDMDVFFSSGVFDRGWRIFSPECSTE